MAFVNKIKYGLTLSSGSMQLVCVLFSVISIAVALFMTLFLNYKFDLLVLLAFAGIPVVYLCISNTSFGFYLMVVMAFLISWLTRFAGRDLPLASLINVLSYVVFGGMLIQNMIKRKSHWLEKDIITLLLLFFQFYLIVEVFNPNMDSFLGWFTIFRGLLSNIFFFFIGLYIFDDIKKIRFFVKFMVGMAILAGVYGCYQQWFGFPSFEQRWLFSDPKIARLYSIPGGGFRKFSSLSDPATYGTLMASVGVATLILAAGPFMWWKRIMLLAGAIFVFLGMAYSGTRTAYVMLPAGIFLYTLMTIYRRRTQVLAVFFSIVFAVVLFFPYYGNPTLNRIRSAFQPKEDASFNVRVINRARIQPYIYDHPFGGGLNTAGANGKRFNPNHYLSNFPPDSGYLSIAMEAGWVGLIIMCFLFFVVLLYAVHYYYKVRSPEIKNYYAAIIALFFTLMLANYAQFAINPNPQNFYFYPFLACIIKLHKFDTLSPSSLNEKNDL